MSVRSLNKVMLIGNLTRDPNLRYTPNNTAVCSFGLATNRSWMPSEGGDRQERTDFHNIVAWSKLAEICNEILKKGDKVYVEGRMQTRDWKTEDGAERRVTEIVIENMIKLGSPKGGESGDEGDEIEIEDAPDVAGKEPAAKKENLDDDKVNTEAVAEDIPF